MMKKQIAGVITSMILLGSVAACTTAMAEQTDSAKTEAFEETADEKVGEGADTDWYMAVLSDKELMKQCPYYCFTDVNQDKVPVLVIASTEDPFIKTDDKAFVYLYSKGDPKMVMELGGGGGDKLYSNEKENTLTHYSRVSGESHFSVYKVKDGELELVTTVDTYAPHHDPDVDNADTEYFQDGAEITEKEADALMDEYTNDQDVLSYDLWTE